MKREVCLAAGIAAACCVPATAKADVTYVYNVGPNYVNIGGDSCRATTETDEINASVNRNAGMLLAYQDWPPLVMYCPLPRRNTTFYGVNSDLDEDTNVDLSSVTVWLLGGGSPTLGMGCQTWRKELGTGSIDWGDVVYLCDTPGGCLNPDPNFSGVNTVTLPFPTPNPAKSVDFGYMCVVPSFAGILYAEAAFTPNP